MKRIVGYAGIALAGFWLFSCSQKTPGPSEPMPQQLLAAKELQLYVGESVQLSTTLPGQSKAPVTWSLISGSGQVSSSGLYAAPGRIAGDRIVSE